MTRDPELQALVDKAERARARDVRPERPAKETPPERPRPAVAFATYMEIDRHSQVGFLWWSLPIFIVLGPVFLSNVPAVIYIAIGLAVALAGRIAYRFLALRHGYRQFLRFPTGLGYPIEGWGNVLGQLVSDPEQWKGECVVVVQRAPGADETVIAAAEELFCRAANSWYYTPDGAIGGASGDPRKQWKRDGQRLIGSSNNWVIGEIYRFARQLDVIQRKVGGIAGIEIELRGGPYSIPRRTYSGD